MYDTVIIGAGLAGLQCARLLGQRGLRVLLVDRKASVTEGVHTTGIFVRKTWEDFPLPDEQLGPGIRDVFLLSPRHRELHLQAARDEFRVGRMPWIYLWLLEQATRSGVTWMPRTHLLRLETMRDVTVLTLAHNGVEERVAARFVVGADGPRSLVARQLGLDRNHEMIVGVEDVVAPRPGAKPALHCFVDPRFAPGYIAWIVDDGHEAHVGVGGYGERFNAAAALRAFRASITDRIPAEEQGVERRGGLIPVNGILRRIANRNGLLIGDAAGAVSPLTAGGLDPAMRLSSFAAEVIEAYLATGDAAVLREYSGDRFRPRFIARRWMRRTIRALQQPLLVELGCAALRTPPLRALASHIFFDRGGSFPDAALSLGRPSLAPSSRP